MNKRLAGVKRKKGKDLDFHTVYWCFFHARREWSDEACSEPARWTLPDGTPLWQFLLAA